MGPEATLPSADDELHVDVLSARSPMVLEIVTPARFCKAERYIKT